MNFTTVYMYVKIFMCMKVKKDVDDKNLLLNIVLLLFASLMRMHPTTSPHVKCYFITHYLITTVPS